MDQLEDFKDTESMNSRPDTLQALFHLVLGAVFFVGSVALFGGLAVAIGSYLYYGEIGDASQLSNLVNALTTKPVALKIFVFVSSSLPLIAAAFLACIFIKATPKHYLSLGWPKNAKWFLIAMLFVFVCVPLMGLMLDINKLIDFSQWPDFYEWLQTQESINHGMYEAMIGEEGTMSLLTSILFMALAPALAEEIFFRGFLMNALNGIFKNMHVSIVVTAVLFSLIHLQFTKIIPMFFLAVSFGYAAYWTGSIWTSITAHFINNALAVGQLYFITDGDYTKALEQGASLPLAVSLGLLSIAILIFAYMQKNADTKTHNFYV